MTVRDFVRLVKDRPELLGLALGHSPLNGYEFPHEAHEVYLDVTEKGAKCVCISGGGYPSRLPDGAWLR